MSQLLTSLLLWSAALGCGLMAGVYFAFSAFVMVALDRVGQAPAIAVMNAINVAIVKSPFMPVFLATTLASAALAVLAVLRWNQPGALVMLAGGVFYVLGMFTVTAACNVPLNDALAAVDPSGPAAAEAWARYLKDWSFWNHLRTVASTAACALFIAALAAEAG
jgi:uncharacterized membrane protein